MKKYWTFLAAALLIGCLGGCQQEVSQAPELLEPVEVKVDTATAQVGEIYRVTAYSGEVVPHVEEAFFLEDGYLKEYHVMINDYVEEGQLLATLDDEQIQEQIKNLEETIAYTRQMGVYNDRQLEISAEIAKREAERIRTGFGNFQQLQLKENEVLRLEADLKQAKELRSLELENLTRQLNERKAELENMELVAPMSGKIVYLKPLETGASIDGYDPVICIADESRLSISSEHITESQIDSADEIYAQVADTAYAVSYIPYDEMEYITMILSGEEMQSHFAIEQAGSELVSGQFATVILKSTSKSDVLLVPANALYTDSKGRYVYKMEGDKRVRQDVEIGLLTDIEVEIEEGLQEGDVVYVKE